MAIMSIPAFIYRCDAYAKRAGVKRTTVSKKLFQMGQKIDELAGGKVDIGVRRLARAQEDLFRLEQKLDGVGDGPGSPPPLEQAEA